MKKLLFILFIFFSTQTFAATYYIDQSASDDSANGTSTSTPWKRCPGMVGFAGSYSHAAGDIFIFKGGETWGAAELPLTIANSGSSGNIDQYTVDTSWYTGASYSAPTLDGEATDNQCVYALDKSYWQLNGLVLTNSADNGLHISGDSNYIYIDNCTVSYASDYGIYINVAIDYIWIRNNLITYNGVHGLNWENGSTNHVITGNTVSYNGQDTSNQYSTGIIGVGNNTLIDNNDVHHNCYAETKSYGHGIYLGYDCSNTVVSNNLVHDNPSGNGIVTRCSAEIYNNRAYDNYYAGIAVSTFGASAYTVNVYYNVMTGNYYGFYDAGTGDGSLTLNVYNNTIYHNTSTDFSSYPKEVRFRYDNAITFKNNIVFGDNSNDEYYVDDTLTNFTASNNILRYGDIYYNAATRTWAYWTETLLFDTSGSSVADPLFKSATDFRLQSTSPAIDNGVNVGLTTDYLRLGIPVGSGYDIGAYEYCANCNWPGSGNISVGSGTISP